MQTSTAKATSGVSKAAERKLAFILLELLFLADIVLVSTHIREIPWSLAPWFVLATLRLAHTVSYNEVMEWLRAPFCEVRKDSCRAGDNVHPKGEGMVRVLGALISCPVCSGQWAALILVNLYLLWQPVGLTLVYVLGFAGAYEVLHYVKEMLEWVGRAARVLSGKIAPDKE